MEYVSVKYSRKRTVYIDGQKAGFTNRTLRVNRGRHKFHLGEPQNYRPMWRRPDVKDTTSLSPMEVTFEEL